MSEPRRLPRRAFLGAELPPDAEAFLDGGMVVAGVLEDAMAARAGVRVGERIVSLAGVPLGNLRQLALALRRAGGMAAVELVTDRATTTVGVVPHPPEPGVAYGELAVAGARLRTLETQVEHAR